MSFYAHVQLADDARRNGELLAAVEDYRAAIDDVETMSRWAETPIEDSIRLDGIYGNWALAELGRGRTGPAMAAVDKALAIDPQSPLFQMSAGFVADRANNRDKAIKHNTAALALDPGAFPVANDLGVQLARSGRTAEAEVALRQAIAAPLPAEWSLSSVERRAPVASAGVLAVLLLAIGLARREPSMMGRDFVVGLVEPVTKRISRLRWGRQARHPLWAVVCTTVVLAVPALRQVGLGAVAVVAFVVGGLVTALAALRLRAVVARRTGDAARQEAWVPGMVFGLVTIPLGSAWAPLPVTRNAIAARQVYSAAPLALAFVCAVLFLEAALLGTPLVRSLAVALLVMTASTLTPVAPLDGARLGKAGLLADAGIVVAAIVVALGLA
jgi:hypothetical protein